MIKNLLMLCLCLTGLSQKAMGQDCEVKNLVFEGAGIRGIAYAGVIEVLEQQGRLAAVRQVGGTSAGAITALMLSLGYSAAEIKEIIASTQFRKFNDGRFMFVGGILRLRNRYGWYRGEKFSDWLADLIQAKTGNADITFAELSRQGFKDLSVTAISVNRQQLLVFSRETYPHMKVKDAVRASMSIPLYFKPLYIDQAGAVFANPNKIPSLDIVVDGGITGNFPIFLFDQTRPGENGQKLRVPNNHTLGVRIDSEEQIRQDAVSPQLSSLPIQDLNDYVSALYIFVLENLNRHQLTESDWKRTISVSSAGISPRIKKLSASQKEGLVQSGRNNALEYLRTRCAGS